MTRLGAAVAHQRVWSDSVRPGVLSPLLALVAAVACRDLIDSADKIIAIAAQCDSILKNVTNIQVCVGGGLCLLRVAAIWHAALAVAGFAGRRGRGDGSYWPKLPLSRAS